MNSEKEGVNMCFSSVWEGPANASLILQVCQSLQGIYRTTLIYKKSPIINVRSYDQFINCEAHAGVPENPIICRIYIFYVYSHFIVTNRYNITQSNQFYFQYFPYEVKLPIQLSAKCFVFI